MCFRARLYTQRPVGIQHWELGQWKGYATCGMVTLSSTCTVGWRVASAHTIFRADHRRLHMSTGSTLPPLAKQPIRYSMTRVSGAMAVIINHTLATPSDPLEHRLTSSPTPDLFPVSPGD